MSLSIVIMAAGKGTRMKSSAPKVLHRIAGKPMLAHVIATTSALQAERLIVITGHGAEQVEARMRADFADAPLNFVRQEPQLGTGHAVQQAIPVLPDEGITLILNGDVPLIELATA
ncbi:MAG: UDP-N-acetylglucosamine diphosphorylase/glucosamine-phosphate N-acetyltransferase, partial [Pseudomonadota bacterium]